MVCLFGKQCLYLSRLTYSVHHGVVLLQEELEADKDELVIVYDQEITSFLHLSSSYRFENLLKPLRISKVLGIAIKSINYQDEFHPKCPLMDIMVLYEWALGMRRKYQNMHK